MTIEKELIIAGLARDCAHSLPQLLPQLDQLADRFANHHFILLENDSLDGTKELLKTCAEGRTNWHIENHDHITKRHPKRTDRLAFLRNRTIDIATNIVEQLGDAYLLLLDLDGANTLIDQDRIAHHVITDDHSWTGLFANQRQAYYDLWALRHPDYCPDDIWKKVRERPASMSKSEAIETFITAIRFTIPEQAGLIEVDSAFGGMGLYRLSALANCRYVGLDAQGEEICEHVSFNADIRAKGGRLFIDAALINAQGNEPHAPQKSKWQKKKDKLRLFFRQV